MADDDSAGGAPSGELDSGKVTAALQAASDGQAGADAALYGIVYDELRQMARRKLMRLAPGQTLQATALVHEAWLKIENANAAWSDRAHFFGVVSRAMRNILVDEARRKASAKRGGGRSRISVDSVVDPDTSTTALELLALDEALTDLDQLDHRLARVVMLRYFSGLGVPEVASMLGVSERTVERDWRFARSWLQERMTDHPLEANDPDATPRHAPPD